MTAVGLLVLGVGVTLIYCGVKGEDPREVALEVLSGRRKDSAAKGGLVARPTTAPLANISPIGE